MEFANKGCGLLPSATRQKALDEIEPMDTFKKITGDGGEERKIEIFQRKLAALINELSLENLSNTPDFILAEHLTDCLYQHARIINKRENWYGRLSAEDGAPVEP